MKHWRIVGFNHPDRELSIVYKQNLTDEQLLSAIRKHLADCNLFSIRGFEKE